ncbi:hypothetical protein DIPPA_05473 [Diplonema papillatum]|nr:hypothetical protein DIPPA_20122 [Diplonema papillatum]KAJ9435799.1 hypothetical protein DIPPA_30025 [Diplonema papillatum]KAJ9440951.1 hypothetical protein DIPPA_05473 [Diplonema papillatum]
MVLLQVRHNLEIGGSPSSTLRQCARVRLGSAAALCGDTPAGGFPAHGRPPPGQLAVRQRQHERPPRQRRRRIRRSERMIVVHVPCANACDCVIMMSSSA